MTHAVLAFGRMNPPTTGHEKFIKKTHDVAKKVGGKAHVVASHSEGDSKNPIPQKKKLEYIKKIAHKDVHVSGSSKQHPSILHHAAKLHAAGHQHLHVVAAGKREKEFHSLLHKYNGKKSSHGHYHFKSITVHSAGKRDPDSHDHSEGVSGTSMRQHAHDNNHKEFKKGLPKALHPHKEEIMNHIKTQKEDLDQGFEDLIEALNVVQRIKRKLIMRRIRPKINRAKRLFKHRKVPEKNLQQRARKAGIRFVRKRVAGKKGTQYTKLSAAAKMHIDKKVSKQQKIVTNIARRLLPRTRKSELVRLQRNELEQDFADYLKERTNATTRQDGKPFEKEHNPTVAANTKHKYKEKNEKGGRAAPVTEQDLQALYLKATKGEYPFETILEVFVRGIEDWDGGGNSPAQYAFNRVNSFVAGGKAYEMDGDLVEASSKHAADQTSQRDRKIGRKSDALRSKQSVSTSSTTLFKRRHGGKTSQHRKGTDATVGRSSSAETTGNTRRPTGGIKKAHRDLTKYSEPDFRRVHGVSKSAMRQKLAKENFAMSTGSAGHAQSDTTPAPRVKKKKVLEWGTDEATAHAKNMTPGEVSEVSDKTLASYQSKASDARGHRTLSTKKVDNRYAGVKKASDRLDASNKGKSFLQGLTDRRNKGIKSKPIDKDKFFGKKKVKEGLTGGAGGSGTPVVGIAGVADKRGKKKVDESFKKGDTVTPSIGPHKGVKHEVIHDHGDGSYNIRPVGLQPRQIKYRVGAAKAKAKHLKLHEKMGFDTHTDVVANTKAASKKPKRGGAKCEPCDETPLPSVVHEASLGQALSKSVDDTGAQIKKYAGGKYSKSDSGGSTLHGPSGQQLSKSSPRIGGMKVTQTPDSKMGPGSRGVSTTKNYQGSMGGAKVSMTSRDGVARSTSISKGGHKTDVDLDKNTMTQSYRNDAGKRVSATAQLGATDAVAKTRAAVDKLWKGMAPKDKAQSTDTKKLKNIEKAQKVAESVIKESDDDHHATVTYHKGTYSMPGKNDGDYHKVDKKIPLTKVDTSKGFSRTSQSTGIEVKKHKIHKQMEKDGYSIHSVSHPSRPKHYKTASGRLDTKYESVNLKFSEWLEGYGASYATTTVGNKPGGKGSKTYTTKTRIKGKPRSGSSEVSWSAPENQNNEQYTGRIPPWRAPNSGREGMSRKKLVKSMIQQKSDRDKRIQDRMSKKAKVADTRKTS